VFRLFCSLALIVAFTFGLMVPVEGEWEKAEAYSYHHDLYFPLYRFPETGNHIRDAISWGHSSICTIDRNGADQRRRESLAGWPTRDGYDRDEYPMAMCLEGGAGASVRYITPSDNRGAGSWVGNAVRDYPDGTRVKFKVVLYDPNGPIRNCSDFPRQQDAQYFFEAAGPGDPHRLDGNNNGVACEHLP
jgi:hypothetical protein